MATQTKRKYAIIRSPGLSGGRGKVSIMYTTHTRGGHRKAAHNFSKSTCTRRRNGRKVSGSVRKAKSPYCRYKVFVVDYNKLMSQGAGTLVRVYEVQRYKFPKTRPLDIGSVIIPTKAKQKVRYNSSYRLPARVSFTRSYGLSW